MPKYTIVISDEAAAKAEREGQKAGWTPEMFIAWLVESYEAPGETSEDDDA